MDPTLNQDQIIPCETVTALNHYLGQLRLRDSSPHTIDAYGRDLNGFFKFITDYRQEPVSLQLLSDLKLMDFRAYISFRSAQDHHRRSVLRAITALRGFLRFLEQQGLGRNDQIGSLRLPAVPISLPRPLSPSEINASLPEIQSLAHQDWLGKRDLALFILLYGAGLRIAEALAIRAANHPLPEILRIEGKGGKVRLVPILPIIQSAVADYVKSCPYRLLPDQALFVGARGDELNPGVVQRQMRLLRYRLGLADTVTPHALRHSFASHLLANGGDLRSIQELLGHSSLHSTQVYTQIDTAKLKDAHRRSHPRG
ncbi:MAG: tyrosine recombinase XerC [Candidatus Pacebacteria bacterium]|nr:tyrosine recombinase XerC [Candidatus Paceibacterota bacterium]